LASLRELHKHAETLASLADSGNWEALALEAQRNPVLFAELSRHRPDGLSASEKTEARQLLNAVLTRYAAFRTRAEPWLRDVGQLLRDIDKHG
jgi:hypothetical protein